MSNAQDALLEIRAAVARQQAVDRVLSKIRDMVASLETEPGLEVIFGCAPGDDGEAVIIDVTLALRPVKQIAAPAFGASPGADESSSDRLLTPRSEGPKSQAAPGDDGQKPSVQAPTKPAPPAKKPVSDTETPKTGPFTTDETETLITALKAGTKIDEIARHLGRSRQSVSSKIYNLKRNGALDAPKPAARPASPSAGRGGGPAHAPKADAVEPKRDAAPASAPSGGDDGTPPLGASLDPVLRAEKHLEKVSSDEWTDEDDLHLLSAFSRGDKKTHIATVLGVDVEFVVKRFKKLCPDPSMEAQGALIKALKRRLGLVGA